MRKKRQIEILNIRLEEAQERIKNLKKKLEDEKKKTKEKLLKDYFYAILVTGWEKGYPKLEFYNDGRIEEHVRSLSFELEPGELPQLTINK